MAQAAISVAIRLWNDVRQDAVLGDIIQASTGDMGTFGIDRFVFVLLQGIGFVHGGDAQSSQITSCAISGHDENDERCKKAISKLNRSTLSK